MAGLGGVYQCGISTKQWDRSQFVRDALDVEGLSRDTLTQ